MVAAVALALAFDELPSSTDVEPNYTGACVRLQLDGFAWADFDCATRLPALCEHDG